MMVRWIVEVLEDPINLTLTYVCAASQSFLLSQVWQARLVGGGRQVCRDVTVVLKWWYASMRHIDTSECLKRMEVIMGLRLGEDRKRSSQKQSLFWTKFPDSGQSLHS